MSDSNNRDDPRGLKTFFLHPSKIIGEDVADGLIASEYEVYTFKDHAKAARALKTNPNSILFINIDDGMKETEWENYIRSITVSPEYGNVKIGILTTKDDPRIIEKYLKTLALPLGYHLLKDNVNDDFRIVLDILRKQNAQGRRRFIRADCSNDPRSTLNMKKGNDILHARLLDLSAAGTACRFEIGTRLKPNTYLRDLQLNLRGVRLRVDCIFMGTRANDPLVHVMLFDPKTDKTVRGNIHKYIRLALQRSMEQETP